MIGVNSIFKTYVIKNNVIKVQVNKNYGICDIIVPENLSYLRTILMDKFQGQQLNNDLVEYRVLYTIKENL